MEGNQSGSYECGVEQREEGWFLLCDPPVGPKGEEIVATAVPHKSKGAAELALAQMVAALNLQRFAVQPSHFEKPAQKGNQIILASQSSLEEEDDTENVIESLSNCGGDPTAPQTSEKVGEELANEAPDQFAIGHISIERTPGKRKIVRPKVVRIIPEDDSEDGEFSIEDSTSVEDVSSTDDQTMEERRGAKEPAQEIVEMVDYLAFSDSEPEDIEIEEDISGDKESCLLEIKEEPVASKERKKTTKVQLPIKFKTHDAVEQRESSIALHVFLKMIYNQDSLTNEQRLEILDFIPSQQKVSLSIMLGAGYHHVTSKNNKKTLFQHPVALPVKQARKKPNQTSTSKPVSGKKRSKPAALKRSKAVTKSKKQKTSGPPCAHIYRRGARKGQSCEATGEHKICNEGLEWPACTAHKHLVEKAIVKQKKKEELVASTKERGASAAPDKAKEETIALSKVVHLCGTVTPNNSCQTCFQANVGDLRVVALAHAQTRTEGEKSGFLKVFVNDGPHTWAIVFITINTAFEKWSMRYETYDMLKEYFNEANSVCYKVLASGRFAYQLECDPVQEKNLPLDDRTIRDLSAVSTDEQTVPSLPASVPQSSTPEVIQESKENEKEEISVQEQKKRVKEMVETVQKEDGAIWYLIASDWYANWKEYVALHVSDFESKTASLLSESPGPINNRPLVKGEKGEEGAFTPCKHLEEGKDYELVSECVWKYLASLYGGGPELGQPLVYVMDPAIEQLRYGVTLYPFLLSLVVEKEGNQVGPFVFSEFMPIGGLVSHGKDSFPPPEDSQEEWALFKFFQGQKRQQYEDLSITAQEAGIANGSTLFVGPILTPNKP